MSRTAARASALAACILVLSALIGLGYWLRLRRGSAVPTIAFVPQTAGSMLWDAEHTGATAAADKWKCHLYWNAPTSENDLAGQVSLIDKVGRGNYQGLVLAPNHPIATLAPVRRVLAAGLPVVIVSSTLDLPASPRLAYLVNDDEKAGELAAAEIARLIQGKGSIAIIGVGRYAPGVIQRARGAERFLSTRFPGIRVVSRGGGAYTSSRAEELTGNAVSSHPGLDAILALTAISTRGAHAALKTRSLQSTVYLVGCEQDADLISYVASGEIAAILAENTYRMGYEAVGLILASLAGKPIPAKSVIAPLLITKQTLNLAGNNLVTGLAR